MPSQLTRSNKKFSLKSKTNNRLSGMERYNHTTRLFHLSTNKHTIIYAKKEEEKETLQTSAYHYYMIQSSLVIHNSVQGHTNIIIFAGNLL